MQRDSIELPATGAGRAPEPRDDAEALVDLVRKSTGQIVVVIGPRNSGKSQFICEQVLSRLGPSGPVLFFDCASQITDEALDAVSRPGAVVILDSFDRFLRLPEAIREPGLEALFAKRRGATVVLVVGKQCLADLFDLRRLAPDILEHLFKMTELKLATELPRYCPPSAAAPLSWEPKVIEALEDDLARLAESTVTRPLVAIIDEGFRTGAYDPRRGLIGLLEKHLERTLARLSREPGFDDSAVEVARAVLKEIAAGGQRGTLSLVGLAERLDVPAKTPALCCGWLVETSGLLKESAGEGLVFQPPQLRIVLEKWLEEDRNACARAERYLADGVEGRCKVGTLLPRERFDDIHAQRSLLRTTPEQASFLTLCALRSHPDADSDPVNYWFRRIGDSTLEVCTLGEALVDPSAPARRRAASMLVCRDEPRVHGHLCRAVLEDAAAEVRDEAVKSLSGFENKGPIRDVLTRAASEGTGDTRIRAIEALRIFQDEKCARFLEEIVSSPGELAVREAAIDALARTRCEAGVSALVRIALGDPDQEDRDRAGAALADLGSENLTDFGLNAALQDWVAGRPARDGRWWKKLGHWPAALVILVWSFYVHGLPLLVFRRWLAGVAFFAVEVACLTLWLKSPTRDWWLLVWLLNWCASIAVAAWVARRKQARPGTFYRVLSNALLANTMLSGGLLLHGLGHWITGRKRQAWQLLGIEAVAVAAILSTVALKNVFNLGIGRTGFDKFAQVLFYMYSIGGWALSLLWAVSSLVIDERWGRRGPWLSEPHSRVLRALLKAPESALVLRRNLAGDPAKVRSARMLLERFGEAVPGTNLLSVLEQDIRAGRRSPPEIVHCLSRHKDKKGYETVVAEAGKMFDGLPPGQRNQLVDLLASHPTEASIQCLFEQRGGLRPWNRIRLWIAVIVRPFRGWYWTVRIATLAGALLAVLLIVDGVRTSFNPGWPQIKELRRLSRTDYPDKSRDVARVAGFLAEGYPASSAAELVTLFREVKEQYAPGLASSLGLVATSDAAKDEARKIAVDALVDAVLDTKKEQPVRDAALRALEDAAERGGSVELVDRLTTLFDKLAPSDTRSAANEQLLQTQLLKGRVAAMLVTIAGRSTNTEWPSIQSRAAKDAIAARAHAVAELKGGLPAEIAKKLEVPSGHAAAVTLDAQARRLRDNGKLADALKKAREAVEADEHFADARGTLGSILYQSGNPEESLKELRVATTIAPKYSWAYYMQALILTDKKRYKEAEGVLNEAIQIDPSHPWSYVQLREIYLDQGLDSEAVAELQRFQRRYPKVGEIYAQLAYVYHERMARSDPTAYQLAYEANQKLLDLVRGREPARALEAELNLVECSLTTGRYQELIQKVPDLLARIGPNPDRRMTLKLLMLSAQVLQHDDPGALKTLAEFEKIYNREFRPSGMWHNWTYDGTVLYLEKRVPPSARTAAVLELVRAVNNTLTVRRGKGPPPVIPQKLFDNIRTVLEPVKSSLRSKTMRVG
jgi:tetratricopeptide (TPR) repeat protein